MNSSIETRLQSLLKKELNSIRKSSSVYPNLNFRLKQFGEDALASEILTYASQNGMSLQSATANLESSYE